MHNLLQQMEFNIITGFGSSYTSFRNNEDTSKIGQGVLQGSSSAAPLYNVNSDVSLAAYRKLAKGAVFTHSITGDKIEDKTTQYVDDKSDMLNDIGAGLQHSQHLTSRDRNEIFSMATDNSTKWASILWISGGQLNSNKCFYYFLKPKYNFSTHSTTYLTEPKTPGSISIMNPSTNTTQTLQRHEPHPLHNLKNPMKLPTIS
jgi:hypothetical protein